MANENAKLEIKKKSQDVTESELKNVAGGMPVPDTCNQTQNKKTCNCGK